jgi:hypothetical protein
MCSTFGGPRPGMRRPGSSQVATDQGLCETSDLATGRTWTTELYRAFGNPIPAIQKYIKFITGLEMFGI